MPAAMLHVLFPLAYSNINLKLTSLLTCSDIYMMGAKPPLESDLNRVEQVIKDLRLDQEVGRQQQRAVRKVLCAAE